MGEIYFTRCVVIYSIFDNYIDKCEQLAEHLEAHNSQWIKNSAQHLSEIGTIDARKELNRKLNNQKIPSKLPSVPSFVPKPLEAPRSGLKVVTAPPPAQKTLTGSIITGGSLGDSSTSHL